MEIVFSISFAIRHWENHNKNFPQDWTKSSTTAYQYGIFERMGFKADDQE